MKAEEMTREEKVAYIEAYMAELEDTWPKLVARMKERAFDLDIGRENLPLCRIPPDMEFTMKDGHTEYEVVGHFDPDGEECLFQQIIRRLKQETEQ